ncbi:MAG: hypothetical protein CMF04_16220 [Hyphomonas sp.]|nr:hypothetical protein [Hyphomonas sp.]
MPASVTGMGAIGTSLLLLAVMASARTVMTGLHRLLMARTMIWAHPVVGCDGMDGPCAMTGGPSVIAAAAMTPKAAILASMKVSLVYRSWST